MVHHEWGWMLIVDLFLGGLGAGCLFFAGLAHLSRREFMRGIARTGALMSPLLVIAGCVLLLFDLGRPMNFWRMFVVFRPVSPMWIGSWLLMLFTLVAFGLALLYLPPSWLQACARRAGPLASMFRKLAAWNTPAAEDSFDQRVHETPALIFPKSPRPIAMLRDMLAIGGMPLGIGVGIYTGVLLGAVPARPFWNTPLVAQLFLFSALSTATALLLVLTPHIWQGSDQHRGKEHRLLVFAALFCMSVEVLMIVPFVIHAQLSTLSVREAMVQIMGGPYTTVFWGGVVSLGLLVPFGLLGFGSLGRWQPKSGAMSKRLVSVAAVLILVGGYLLRWVVVHAGQDTWFL